MRLVEIPLASATRRAIFEEFLVFARRGIDVQTFDPHAENRGTKPATASQRGYYGDVDVSLLHQLGQVLHDILRDRDEANALGWFEQIRRLPHADLEEAHAVAPLNVLPILPDVFDAIEPEDFRSPSGLRIPESIRDHEAIRQYSGLLLLPKLVLAAVAGLTEMSPWLDRDMDLGSAVHTIRPDADKLADGSGYGAADLVCHTDGYWAEQAAVPAWNVMLCASNPFDEPTNFIRVADLFRILDQDHSEYESWAASFSDLRRRGQSPREFVAWVLEEAVKPQFGFVMGRIGSGATRSVRGVPLLEKHRILPGFLFRYKSTFSVDDETAQPMVDFVNRMVARLSDGDSAGLGREVKLRPGSVVFALNGCCLQVSPPRGCAEDGVEYAVSGSATIHGRRALRIIDSRVERTLVRCNLLPASGEPNSSGPDLDAREGQVAALLESGYRANHLQR